MLETYDLYDWVNHFFKDDALDPATFEFRGPSDEQKLWPCIYIMATDIFEIGQTLRYLKISSWYWRDRAPDRMVHRYTIFIEDPENMALFKIGFPYQDRIQVFD